MVNQSLIHEVAFLCAQGVLGIFCCLLREDEQKDAFWETYEVIRTALIDYEARADRRFSRLHPSKN